MKRGIHLMRRSIILLGVAVTMLPILASAQMVKPSFGPELAKLSFIVGHFTTVTHIMMGDNTSEGAGTIKAHWGLDSMFVMFASQETNAGLGSYKGFGVLGYNSADQKYMLTMFNNFGDRPEYKGTFAGDTLVMTGKVENPQGAFDQELKWFKDGDAVRLQVYNDFGQGYTIIVDQKAKPSNDTTKLEQAK